MAELIGDEQAVRLGCTMGGEMKILKRPASFYARKQVKTDGLNSESTSDKKARGSVGNPTVSRGFFCG
jgi:hypothetical protein